MKIQCKHINQIKVNQVLNDPKTVVLRKKRERMVFKNQDLIYKIWVQNWPQGDIAKYAFDSGYYDESNCPAIDCLFYDESGQRGYIMKEGRPLGSNWEDFCKLTSIDQRFDLMNSLLNNSKKAKGLYTDLYPTNMVMYKDKICLVDLDSFNSFSFVFNKQKMEYEKFDLNAWWKPYETITRDLNKFYREYFELCLSKPLDFEIDNIESIDKMKKSLNEIKQSL